jgi:hypothetical protein
LRNDSPEKKIHIGDRERYENCWNIRGGDKRGGFFCWKYREMDFSIGCARVEDR